MNTLKLITGALLLGAAGLANASAIISDGNIKLGVMDLGNLNVNSVYDPDVVGEGRVGLRYLTDAGEYEATTHGCECEGWGVAVGELATSGYANNSAGTGGLSLVNFSSTATTATSVTSMSGLLEVTHNFALATETDNLYRVTVSIENTSGVDIANLLYRRTFDWDTSPTPFSEYVTIGGSAAATAVSAANNNGFCSSDPLNFCSDLGATGDFTAFGPTDHGANFDFDFGALAAGETFTFEIFYGAADNRADALTALGEVGAEVYSLGWSYLDADQNGLGDINGEVTPTFIFGFAGVGGEALPDPTDVPEPGTLLLFGLGILGLGAARRRAQKV